MVSETSIPDDVATSHGTGQPCPWNHFDAEWYADTNMRRSAATDPTDPLEHYTTLGAARRLSPNPYFDEAWYLSTYPDVRNGIGEGLWESGFAHYRKSGHVDRDPHWLFCDSFYRSSAGPSGEDPRIQVLCGGHSQGRPAFRHNRLWDAVARYSLMGIA